MRTVHLLQNRTFLFVANSSKRHSNFRAISLCSFTIKGEEGEEYPEGDAPSAHRSHFVSRVSIDCQKAESFEHWLSRT